MKTTFKETQEGIKLVKDTFEKELAKALTLTRVTAPRFLVTGTGLQDDLAGTQDPVRFTARGISRDVEIVHSLAKWKRHTLGRYDFRPYTGIYTDMDAIRKDEDISEIHSFYVDQWDWEVVIRAEDRTITYLKKTVEQIYRALKKTQKKIMKKFPGLRKELPKKIIFVHTEDLEKEYPLLSAKEREYAVTKKYGAVFLIGIGYPLASGKPHDLRASDYDDWSTETSLGRGLDGDIIVWDDARKQPLELSSMGIRVDAKALELQHKRPYQEFHKAIRDGKLPLTIGGGIGQSRLCQLLLEKRHIGEVQCSVWSDKMKREATRQRIMLLE